MRAALKFKTSVALDLGWVVDIDVLTENGTLRRHRDDSQDTAPVRSTDLFPILDGFCDPSLPQSATLDHSKLAVGTFVPLTSVLEEPSPFNGCGNRFSRCYASRCSGPRPQNPGAIERGPCTHVQTGRKG